MLVLAIDPGLRCLGYCLMDGGKRLLVGLDDLFQGGEIKQEKARQATMAWVESHRDLLEISDVVLVEKQFVSEYNRGLSAALITVMTCIQKATFDKCRIVAPTIVKRAYKTKAGSHHANKVAAVAKAVELDPTIADPEVFLGNHRDASKIDDVCDAFLMAHWFFYKGVVPKF